MKRSYRRRRFITHKKIQGRFILFFVLASALGSAFSVYLFNRVSIARVENLLYSIHIPKIAVCDIFLDVMVYSYVLSLLLIIFIFIFTTKKVFARLSHPLSQITADLHRMRKGKLNSRIELRHKDEFQDFADLINTMAEETGHRFTVIATHAHQLSELVGTAMVEEDNDKTLFNRLDHHVTFLEKDIGSYKR